MTGILGSCGSVLWVCHNLQLDSFTPEVIEKQLGPRNPLGVNSTWNYRFRPTMNGPDSRKAMKDLRRDMTLVPATLTASVSWSPGCRFLYFSMNSVRDISTWNLCGYGSSPVPFSSSMAWERILKYCCLKKKKKTRRCWCEQRCRLQKHATAILAWKTWL